jgi:hypothetical protein
MSNRAMSTWKISNIDFLIDNNVDCNKVDIYVVIELTSLQTSLNSKKDKVLDRSLPLTPHHEPYLFPDEVIQLETESDLKHLKMAILNFENFCCA